MTGSASGSKAGAGSGTGSGTKALTAAIIGYGRNGSTMHAGPLEALDDFKVIAVCDIDADARKKAQDRFSCPVYEDYKHLLAAEKPDLTVIVTRSHQHTPMAIDCLRAGRNVLVTKPWALNADGARAMIAASKASGAMLLPWLPARWGTDLTRLKELVASGAIGKVFQIRRSVSTFGIRHDWQTQKDCGGGYLLNWGPHIVDQPVQLSGSRVVSAFAQMRQVINPGDVEDHFFGVLVAENGIIIQVEHNIAAQGLFDWIVQGDRGTIYVRNGTELELHRVSFPENFDPASYRNAVTIDVTKETLGSRIYGDETEIYRHIARALRKQEPYAVAPESALTLSMELDAIRASSASGEAVRIA